MKIDLCRLFGVEEGEEFKLVSDNSESKYIIVDNILNLVIGNRPYVSELTINDINAYKLKIIKLPKKKQFSQDTLNFFKMIDESMDKLINVAGNSGAITYKELNELKDIFDKLRTELYESEVK